MITKKVLLAYITELEQKITELDFQAQELDHEVAVLKDRLEKISGAKSTKEKAHTGKRPVGRPRKQA